MTASVVDPRVGTATRAVLVVDDDPDLRTLSCRRLERHGFVTVAAATGEEALELLATHPGVDLVLLDYRLPGRNGVDTLHEIRRLDGPSVVLATGAGSESVAVDALRGGAIDYLRKGPDFLAQLPGAMERAWQVHDLRQRTSELQRLALLVTSAEDRSTVLEEVVRGAHRLLRAQGCALFVMVDDQLRLQTLAGDVSASPEALAREAAARLRADGTAVVDLDSNQVFVPLTSPDGPPQGVLVMANLAAHQSDREELRLAETLGAFAGIAIANVRRLELEREMVAQLETLVEARRQFVTSVSHELRTPLTCIRGFASTLLQHSERLQADERRECLEMIHQHSLELSGLLEQLLEAARVEMGQVEVQMGPVALHEEIPRVLRLLGPLLGDRTLVCDIPELEAMADVQLLRRTLNNLMSNAVKYSPTGSPIGVRVAADGPRVRVEVSDEGPGLDREDVNRAFEPFWRSSAHASVRGTGLGLTLVREYATAMDAEVRASSAPGCGSTFTLLLRAVTGGPAAQKSLSSSDSIPRSAS